MERVGSFNPVRAAIIVSAAVVTLVAGCSDADSTTATPSQTPATSAPAPQSPTAEAPISQTDFCTAATQWAQSKATDEQLEDVTDRLLLAMHDLRTVLVRKKADRLTKG